MVVVDINLSSLFFFMLGFISCAAIIIVFAILWVILPRINEAKRFFDSSFMCTGAHTPL